MSSIVIGKAGTRNVTIDLDVLLRTRLLVQANSGGGMEIWKPKLRDGARRMLDVLVEAGGGTISKEELGERAHLQKSGTFSAYLSDLKTARLAVVAPRRCGGQQGDAIPMSAGYRERLTLQTMREVGYDGVRAAGSRGLWDVICWRVRCPESEDPPHARATLVLIQVKSTNDLLSRGERVLLAKYEVTRHASVSKQVWTFPVRKRGGLPKIEFIP